MKSFKNWFGRRAEGRSARPTVRPSLESLEARNLLNASPVLSASGALTTFVVYNGGQLWEYSASIPGGGAMIAQGVRVAHGYRDVNGQVGVDIVYTNGAAYEFDSTHAIQLGTSNVLDASRAYDAKGNFELLVDYSTGSGGAGNLFEYTNTSAQLLAQNVTFASAYEDLNGNLGIAVGFFDSGHGTDQVFTHDSTGVRTLYNGSSGGDPVTDYDQATPVNLANAAAASIIDVTFGFGGCLQFGPGFTVVGLGSDNVGTA